MQKVILDTSSLIFGLGNKRDVIVAILEKFPDAKIVVSRGVVRELKKIGDSKRKESKYAKVALLELEKYGIGTAGDSGSVDDWILSTAEKGIYVCTNDINLKKRLKMKGVGVFGISRSGALR